jgi:hypothetical protein
VLIVVFDPVAETRFAGGVAGRPLLSYAMPTLGAANGDVQAEHQPRSWLLWGT